MLVYITFHVLLTTSWYSTNIEAYATAVSNLLSTLLQMQGSLVKCIIDDYSEEQTRLANISSGKDLPLAVE